MSGCFGLGFSEKVNFAAAFFTKTQIPKLAFPSDSLRLTPFQNHAIIWGSSVLQAIAIPSPYKAPIFINSWADGSFLTTATSKSALA